MFAVFFKIGLFSFGGGYAMLSMIEHEVVDKHKWLTHDELLDVFAIAESTPGAISINIATFIGTKRAGVFGGIFTTLGVVLPSFLVILGLSYIIDIVRENEWVGYLFRGIRIGALVLIVRGAVSFVKNTKRKVIAYVLMAAMFCLALFTDISVIYLMLGAIGISIIEVIVSHSIRYRKFLRNCEKTAGEYSRGGESAPCPEDMLAVNMLSPEEQAATQNSFRVTATSSRPITATETYRRTKIAQRRLPRIPLPQPTRIKRRAENDLPRTPLDILQNRAVHDRRRTRYDTSHNERGVRARLD